MELAAGLEDANLHWYHYVTPPLAAAGLLIHQPTGLMLDVVGTLMYTWLVLYHAKETDGELVEAPG